MTTSILEVLAVLPTGTTAAGGKLTLEELGNYINQHCNTDSCKAREKRHILRDELFNDGGIAHMEGVIDDIFEDPTVKELRKKWIKHSRFNNVIKRIVNETSTNYSEPAKRSVRDESSDDKYQQIIKDTQFDVVMQEASCMYSLHRSVLVGPRVREMESGEREVVVEVVTPAKFRVVLHPNDSSRVIGYIIRTKFRSARKSSIREAHWVLWTSHERVMLDEDMNPIEHTHLEHGIGHCPYVPIKRLKNQNGFWPGEEGEDLVAGHISIWLNNIFQNKETKSATKQTFFQGDLSTAAMNQSNDTETPVNLPEGTAAATIDMSMDTEMFRQNSSFISDSMANNYGMSSAYMKHQGVQSADAREMMRVPLRELRMRQHQMYLMFERQFTVVLAAVVEKDAPSMKFSIDGWKVDFSDPQAPMTPKERLEHYKELRKAGFDNPIAYLMRQNPDLLEEDAEEFILKNISQVTWYWNQTRDLQAMGIGNESEGLTNMPGQATAAPTPNFGGQAA